MKLQTEGAKGSIFDPDKILHNKRPNTYNTISRSTVLIVDAVVVSAITSFCFCINCRATTSHTTAVVPIGV